MAQEVIRILSDLHYGDRASRINSLFALAPLFDGVTQLVLNGDTLDTRPSRNPSGTAALRDEVLSFLKLRAPQTTLITGNHDPDISGVHALSYANRQIFVTHGDVIFEEIVPWSQDAALARSLVSEELARLTPESREQLSSRLGAVRRAAARIPQRHQIERHGLKYLLSYISDTVWPPLRIARVLRAWHETPIRAQAFVKQHQSAASFCILGHVHRPRLWRTKDGLIVLNTGSFCPPLGAAAVDLLPGRLIFRGVTRQRGEFHPGAIIAEFALADE